MGFLDRLFIAIWTIHKGVTDPFVDTQRTSSRRTTRPIPYRAPMSTLRFARWVLRLVDMSVLELQRFKEFGNSLLGVFSPLLMRRSFILLRWRSCWLLGRDWSLALQVPLLYGPLLLSPLKC